MTWYIFRHCCVYIELALAFFSYPVHTSCGSGGELWLLGGEAGGRGGREHQRQGDCEDSEAVSSFRVVSLPRPPPPSPVSGIDFTPCARPPCARTPNLLVYKTSRRVPELQILYMLNFTPCARTPNLIYKVKFHFKFV